jgi:hypothetical protein
VRSSILRDGRETGFEPPLPVRIKRFSRPTVSTAHTLGHIAVFTRAFQPRSFSSDPDVRFPPYQLNRPSTDGCAECRCSPFYESAILRNSAPLSNSAYKPAEASQSRMVLVLTARAQILGWAIVANLVIYRCLHHGAVPFRETFSLCGCEHGGTLDFWGQRLSAYAVGACQLLDSSREKIPAYAFPHSS